MDGPGGGNGFEGDPDDYANNHCQIVKVSAIFNPRTRYFTVVYPRVPDLGGYHQMIPDGDGRLTFADHPPVDQTVASGVWI